MIARLGERSGGEADDRRSRREHKEASREEREACGNPKCSKGEWLSSSQPEQTKARVDVSWRPLVSFCTHRGTRLIQITWSLPGLFFGHLSVCQTNAAAQRTELTESLRCRARGLSVVWSWARISRADCAVRERGTPTTPFTFWVCLCCVFTRTFSSFGLLSQQSFLNTLKTAYDGNLKLKKPTMHACLKPRHSTTLTRPLGPVYSAVGCLLESERKKQTRLLFFPDTSCALSPAEVF